MPEICLDCLNKLYETNDPPEKYIISKQPEICEECGELKPVIIREHTFYDTLPKGLKWLSYVIDIILITFESIKYLFMLIFKSG